MDCMEIWSFEWIASGYGYGVDMDMAKRVVKNYSISLFGSRGEDGIFYYQKELRI